MKRRVGLHKLSRRIVGVFALGVFGLALVLGIASELYLRHTLGRQAELRALALARNLASVARPYLLHYDYIALQQMSDALMKEPDVAYVVILDKEESVGGYGGRRDLQNTRLPGLANQRAIAADRAMTQTVQWTSPGGDPVPVTEAMAPVRVNGDSGQRWGTVRVALSLAPRERELWQARMFVVALLFLGVLGAVVAGTVLARRITRPLERLVQMTASFEGSASRGPDPSGSDDEVEQLATQFGWVAQQLRSQNRALEAAKEELISLNAGLELEVERRTSELSASREQYRLLVEGSPDAFALIDGGRIVFVNEAFTKIFQYPIELVLGETFRWPQMFHPNSHSVAREKFRVAESAGDSIQFEAVGLTRAGRSLNLEVRGRAVTLRGRPVVELVLSDVTEKRQLLRQVVHSERLRAMGEMTAMVAHHFNNLLAVMLGRCQLLQMRAPDETMRNGLSVIQSSALKAGDMLRHLQEYYGEQIDLRFGEVDVNGLLREVVTYQENLWRTTRPADAPLLSTRLELAPVPVVRGSEPLLQDVFRRLLANAAEAMAEGGEILIRSRREGEHVVVTIADPGCGMTQEVLAHAFEPFFSTKGPRARGLGLSAALGIVQRHEGRMRLQSEAGRGSEAEVALPVESRISRIVPLAQLQGSLAPAAAPVEPEEAERAEDAGTGDHAA